MYSPAAVGRGKESGGQEADLTRAIPRFQHGMAAIQAAPLATRLHPATVRDVRSSVSLPTTLNETGTFQHLEIAKQGKTAAFGRASAAECQLLETDPLDPRGVPNTNAVRMSITEAPPESSSAPSTRSPSPVSPATLSS